MSQRDGGLHGAFGVPTAALATGSSAAESSGGSSASGLPGVSFGGSALARAVERWRRVMIQEREGPTAASAAPDGARVPVDGEGLIALARRLDDTGCSYGRVSAARLEQVIRAYDRLETKMNAVLMAVTGTFLSTLAGLLLYYVRGGGQ